MKQPYWLFTNAVVLAALLPIMAQEGMFMDGLIYASVSRNLADGLGSFWSPHYSQTIYENFHEHPPLMFGLEAIFFKLFGDSRFVERGFSLLMAVLTSWGIVKVWGLFEKENSWLPVLCFFLIPLSSWCFQNNMLENTMTVFVVFSVYFGLKFSQEGGFVSLLLGGVCIVLAMLTKGVVALFPIASGGVLWLFYQQYRTSKVFGKVLLFAIVPFGLTALLLLSSHEAYQGLRSYVEIQLLPSVTGERDVTTDNRLGLLVDLAEELIVLILVAGGVFVKTRRKPNQWALLFLVIAISASFPIMVSPKQRTFYLLPSMPFYALAAASVIQGVVKSELLVQIADKFRVKVVSIVLVIGVVLFSAGSVSQVFRDQYRVHDVKIITSKIEEGGVIGGSSKTFFNWSLLAYLNRYGYVSVAASPKDHKYVLAGKDEKIPPRYLKIYEEVQWGLKETRMFKKRD